MQMTKPAGVSLWLATFIAILALGETAAAFQYAPLPADNLITNPWFREECRASTTGWTISLTSDGIGWAGSDKTQNPSDENCEGDFTGFATRWARRSGTATEFSPSQDTTISQVVGPVSGSTLRFHFLFVMHRMNRFRAQISGSHNPSGPFTPVWTPIDQAWLNPGGASGVFAGACPGGQIDRDCWWDETTLAELGSLAPLTFTSPTPYTYYRIEFLGNYPTPDNLSLIHI